MAGKIGALQAVAKYAISLPERLATATKKAPGVETAYQVLRANERGDIKLSAKEINALNRKSAADDLIERSNPLSGPGFIGYLSPGGKFESFGERAAADADYHHSMLVKDMDAYDAEGGLTFVRYGGEPVLTIKGTPAMDPYNPKSSPMFADLAQRLIDEGVHPRTPFKIESMGFSKAEAPYQDRLIGTIGDWATAMPKNK